MRTRRSKRQETDELRAKFIANRERVRTWMANWECPEIEWPKFREVPFPWVIGRGEEQQWLKRHAPFMNEYRWSMEARPMAEGITYVRAHWRFGNGHEFDGLAIEFLSFADPPYLAERLTTGAHTASLKSWRADDVHDLYTWLFEGLDSRPMNDMVRGQKRTGLILFKLLRSPDIQTKGIFSRLSLTMTNTALDGSPLDDEGGTLPR